MTDKPLEELLKEKLAELERSSEDWAKADKWIDEYGVGMTKRLGSSLAKSDTESIARLGREILDLSEGLLNNHYDANKLFFSYLAETAEIFYNRDQRRDVMNVQHFFNQFAAAMHPPTSSDAQAEFDGLKLRIRQVHGKVLFDSTYEFIHSVPIHGSLGLDKSISSFKLLVGESENDGKAVYPDHPRADYVRELLEAVDDFYNIGNEQLGHDRDAKIKILENFVNKVPKYVFGHKSLAQHYFKQRRFDEAEAEFKETLELDGLNVEALYGLAMVCKRKARFVPAKQHLEKALNVLEKESYIEVPCMGKVKVKSELEDVNRSIRRQSKQ
jgi:tetratricopeptide (TPR) repeat protein